MAERPWGKWYIHVWTIDEYCTRVSLLKPLKPGIFWKYIISQSLVKRLLSQSAAKCNCNIPSSHFFSTTDCIFGTYLSTNFTRNSNPVSDLLSPCVVSRPHWVNECNICDILTLEVLVPKILVLVSVRHCHLAMLICVNTPSFPQIRLN